MSATDSSSMVPSLQIVQVNFDAASHVLSVEPSRVAVKPGDTIIWQFANTPRGFFPWVRFDPNDGQPTFGPLSSLSQGGDGLWAQVPTGEGSAGLFTYRASIQARIGDSHNAELATIYSRRVELEIRPESTAGDVASPQKVVQVSKGSQGELVVKPSYVSFYSGEAVVWRFAADIFSEQPETLQPRIEFTRYEGELEVGDLHYGPFTTLTYTAEATEGQVTNQLAGTGSIHRPGLYRYRALAIKESTGEIQFASSDDPVADDVGDPPSSGSG